MAGSESVHVLAVRLKALFDSDELLVRPLGPDVLCWRDDRGRPVLDGYRLAS